MSKFIVAEFIFLGANIDAAEAAENIGIRANKSVQFKHDSAGMGIAMESVAEYACYMRRADVGMEAERRERERAFEDSMERIKEDVRRRGR